MIKKNYIIRFLASFLLLVFCLSSTPKRFLHTLFANHIDQPIKEKPDFPFQLSLAGYNCDEDNQVAEPGYISIQYFQTSLFFTFSSYPVKDNSFASATAIYSSLRGPPVTI